VLFKIGRAKTTLASVQDQYVLVARADRHFTQKCVTVQDRLAVSARRRRGLGSWTNPCPCQSTYLDILTAAHKIFCLRFHYGQFLTCTDTPALGCRSVLRPPVRQ